MSEQLDRKAVVVIGMHRSGTSAMARVLSIAGAALPRDLIPAGLGNEAGHWEPINVANFNDRLLAKLDSRWDSVFAPRRNRKGQLPLSRYKAEAREIIRDQYGDESLIVLKEPRITLLVDFWEDVLRAEGFKCAFVIMVRDPEEVAASLKARDQIERNRALLLWATYTSQADLLTRHARRIFCSFDRLLEEPEAVLDSVEAKLELDLPRRTVRGAAEIDQFLQPALRHHARSGSRHAGALSPVSRLADYCFELVSGASPNEDIAAQTKAWLASLDGAISPVLVALEDQAQSAINETHALRAREGALMASVQDRDARLSDRELAAAALNLRLEALETQRQAELAAKDQALVEREALLNSLRSELQESREVQATADAARAEDARRLAQTGEELARLEAESAGREAQLQDALQRLAVAEVALTEEAGRHAQMKEALARLEAESAGREAQLQDAFERLAVAEVALTEASSRHAQTEEALARREAESAGREAQLQDALERLAVAEVALTEEASRRAEVETELAAVQRQFAYDLAQLKQVEQQASAAHVIAIGTMESRLAELDAQLLAMAESEAARSVEVNGLRAELASQVTEMAQARVREAEATLELNRLTGDSVLLAAERSQAHTELAHLQSQLAVQRELVASQAEALAGYQRSILFRSRELILRARASMLGPRRG